MSPSECATFALGVGVHQKDPLPPQGEPRGKGHGGRGLSRAALVVEDGDRARRAGGSGRRAHEAIQERGRASRRGGIEHRRQRSPREPGLAGRTEGLAQRGAAALCEELSAALGAAGVSAPSAAHEQHLAGELGLEGRRAAVTDDLSVVAAVAGIEAALGAEEHGASAGSAGRVAL